MALHGIELQPGVGPKVVAGIPKSIGDEPDEAISYLRMASGALLKINDMAAYISVQIGRQLREIRDSQLWAKIERRDYRDPSHPEGVPQWGSDKRQKYYVSFEDFIQNGFPMTSGYSGRQAYNFMRLGRSLVVSNLSDYELQKMKSARNVLSMVKIEEAQGAEAVTEQMREDAKKLPNPEFEQKYQVPKLVLSGTVPEASDKQFIVSHLLGRLSEDELHVLKEFVAEGLTRCQDSASDLVSLIGALLTEEWSQDDAGVEEQQDPIQTEQDFVNGPAGETIDVEAETPQAEGETESAEHETVSGNSGREDLW